MNAIRQAIEQMIDISETEMTHFLGGFFEKKFKSREILSYPGKIPNEVYFINQGTVRVAITDRDGTEHTIHFALENQFICDYSCFMTKAPSLYTLQALEDTEVVVMPRAAIDWGYKHLAQGDKLGRLIAEFYFIYQDNRIKNQYTRTVKERYDSITEVFPDIHNRAPQHMIASYLGITAIHLSRLKKEDTAKT
jgi:CRP-like cAMP-binding protein